MPGDRVAKVGLVRGHLPTIRSVPLQWTSRRLISNPLERSSRYREQCTESTRKMQLDTLAHGGGELVCVDDYTQPLCPVGLPGGEVSMYGNVHALRAGGVLISVLILTSIALVPSRAGAHEPSAP